MKNCSLFFFLFLVLAGTAIAQVPQVIPYQAVARNAQGQPLASRAVKVRFSVLDSTATGTAVYVETHPTSTTALGLFAVNVGMGTPTTGNFSNINWGVNSKFLKVELDTTASGNNYIDLGTQQMMSVPYALYSNNSTNGLPSGGVQGQIITLCDGVPVWTSGGQCPGRITALSCSTATNNGTLTAGTSASGVSSTINYTGGNGGSYSTQSVSSTGVTGLTATLSAGSFVNGSGSVTYTITGTAAAAGTASFAITLGGQSCTLTRTVSAGSVSGISTATCGATNVLNPAKTYGSMTDQDGNQYKTIVIGTQEWMAENLKASRYRNGDLIPVVTDATVWAGLTTDAACWYNNDSATYNCPYGKLYNWYTVADARNLCPTGWHVPSDAEWNRLVKYLDATADTACINCLQSSLAGGMMKSAGTQYWLSPNTNATNSSGFSGLPGGTRFNDGSYYNIGGNGHWWSSTQNSTTGAWNRNLPYSNGGVLRNDYNKRLGFSVRCVRD